MNAINSAVLAKISSLAATGRYIILSEEELAEAIGQNADGESIKRACNELADGGYIDLKYSGGGMFCFAPLKTPEVQSDELTEETEEPQTSEVTVVKAGTAAAFFAGLIGGALGSVIAALIMAAI